MTNGLYHSYDCYHLGESTVIFMDIRSDSEFLFHFSMKLLSANRIALDGTPCSTASHLWLYCLPISHKRMSGLCE